MSGLFPRRSPLDTAGLGEDTLKRTVVGPKLKMNPKQATSGGKNFLFTSESVGEGHSGKKKKKSSAFVFGII